MSVGRESLSETLANVWLVRPMYATRRHRNGHSEVAIALGGYDCPPAVSYYGRAYYSYPAFPVGTTHERITVTDRSPSVRERAEYNLRREIVYLARDADDRRSLGDKVAESPPAMPRL